MKKKLINSEFTIYQSLPFRAKQFLFLGNFFFFFFLEMITILRTSLFKRIEQNKLLIG